MTLEVPLTWHVAYTKPRQEEIALLNLQNQGFEAYLPKFKAFKKPRAGSAAGKPLQVVYEPMFPRYVFFKPTNAKQSMGTLRSTRGVASVVMVGSAFANVTPALLEAIRCAEAERDNLDVEQISPYQPGARVRLRDPALQGLEGLIQEASGQRVILLLNILGREKTLKVDASQIEGM